jgi:signal transduction histidine kinase
LCPFGAAERGPHPESSEFAPPDGGFTSAIYEFKDRKPWAERRELPIHAAASKMVFSHPTDGSTEHRPRLVLRFALYAGAVLLAAGLAISWLVNREVASRAQRTLESQARAVVAANLNEHLRPSDFDAPVTRARRTTLDRLFRQSILIPGVVGGRLVGPSGTITYAANHLLIGTPVQHPSELRRVLAGSVERGVVQTQTWQGQKNLKVLRVVAPVRLKGRSQPIGAVELDQDYRAVAVSVGDARGKLALILTLALLALYISLFPILHRVTRELEARNRRLREDADRLRELDRLKDEFISLVSHELRTPLTSIRGYVELLQEDGRLTEDQQRYLGVVDRNSARLLDLVSDLLFLAQVDAGKLAFELQPVELDVVVAECVEASQPTAAAKGIELVSDAQRLPVPLQGDPARLAQVLDNLVSNALKFTPAGGRVEVRLSAADGVALIDVEDNGIGLAEDEQEQLFERFFRSSRAAESAIPGTGLGLAIAKTIVERHGGRIHLESAVDEGTTVRVELPLSLSGSARSPQELAA